MELQPAKEHLGGQLVARLAGDECNPPLPRPAVQLQSMCSSQRDEEHADNGQEGEG